MTGDLRVRPPASRAFRIGAFVVVPFRCPPAAARTWLPPFSVTPRIALPVHLVPFARALAAVEAELLRILQRDDPP